MRMNEGVEWAAHSLLNLAWIGSERAVTTTSLAAYYELPPAYLTKQMQALARAGLVSSTRGPGGGFRLAQAPDDITLLAVVVAIDGEEEGFRCTEIRQRGPQRASARDCRTPCQIASAMHRADQAWRRELAGQTIADLCAEVELSAPAVPGKVRKWFAGA